MGLKNRSIVKVKYVSGSTDTPDVANAAPIQMLVSENRDKFEKDTSFIPIPKPADQAVEDPETLALDYKETNNNWTITGFVRMGADDEYALPPVFRDSNDNGVVSGADDPDAAITTTEQLSFTGFGDSSNANTHSWHLLGAKQIDPSSFILEDADGNPLTEGTDYNIDYNRGKIEIFDNGNIDVDGDGLPNEVLQAGYKYRGRNDNIARSIKRMAERGGAIILEIDPNTYANPARNIVSTTGTDKIFTIAGDYAAEYDKGDVVSVDNASSNNGEYTVVKTVYQSGDDTTDIHVYEDIPSGNISGTGDITKKEGLKYMIHVEAVEIVQNPGTPNEVEVSLDIRAAVDKQ